MGKWWKLLGAVPSPKPRGMIMGVVGGAVGFTEGALFEYQLPLACDQLSLTCEG